MSRKIGLGDTFFDPDIDGDIDYDFFGGEMPTTTAADTSTTTAFLKLREPGNLPMVAGEQAKNSSVPNTAVRNLFEESVNLNNNYDCEPLDDDVRNLNKNENVVVRESVKADGSMASNTGTKELKMMNGDHGDAVPPTVVGSDVEKSDEVNESLNKKLNSHWCENESTEVGPVRNAEDGGGGGVRTKSSSCESPKDNRQSNDDDEGSAPSDCDSASDLYSLTDEDEDEDDDDEDEDDDDDDDEGNDYFLENEGDLDSDITEVSPLSSANMSPLPDSPKRTPEPKAKRYSSYNLASPRMGDRSRRELLPISSSSSSNNSEMSHSKKKQGSMANREESVKQDSVDLKVLAKAILELEEERKRNSKYRNKQTTPEKLHVRSRKNMTFNNDEVRRIDNENKRLLRRIIDSQKPRKTLQHPVQTGRIASSAINRFKELKKIETENLVLLKRLQAAKPTRELSREFLLGSSQKRIPESKSSSSIATTRTASPFVLSVGVGTNKGRGGRCCSMGSLRSNSSSWSGLATSPTKTKSSKLTTNGLGTPHSIASGQ